MQNNSKRKWQIRFAVLAIFLFGALAGALAFNVYESKLGGSSRERRRDRFDEMVQRLNLSTEQKTKVDQIMGEARANYLQLRKESEPKYEDIRKQTDSQLEAVLSPEQWQKWRQMTEEMRKRRGRSPR
jgi:hypothetical protein